MNLGQRGLKKVSSTYLRLFPADARHRFYTETIENYLINFQHIGTWIDDNHSSASKISSVIVLPLSIQDQFVESEEEFIRSTNSWAWKVAFNAVMLDYSCRQFSFQRSVGKVVSDRVSSWSVAQYKPLFTVEWNFIVLSFGVYNF